jgi:hypothetical protein
MADNYLSEALHGDYGHNSEDRLTQIFCAAFNHSEPFRQHVGKFLGCDRLRLSKCETQKYFEGREAGRIDIAIHARGGQLQAVIESKLECKLTSLQLQKYNKIEEVGRCRQKFCLAKKYEFPLADADGWEIKYWSDFRLFLMNSRIKKDSVIGDFMAILRGHGMEIPSKINRADLRTLANIFHNMRFEKEPSFIAKSSAFEALLAINLMLEDLLRAAVKTRAIKDRVGKNFRPGMRIESWIWGEKEKGAMQPLWIGCSVSLPKPHRKLRGFGAALLFYGEK